MNTDVPWNMGGTDSAPQPIELLLMSFIGCTQATAFFVSRHLQIMTTSSHDDETISFELQDMVFHNITTFRDIRHSIQNVPIRVQMYTGGCSNETARDDTMNKKDSPSPTTTHLQEISGTVVVYFRSRDKPDQQPTGHLYSSISGSTAHPLNQNKEVELRALFLKNLQEQTEWRCPIANMIHNSGCSIHIEWKDGGSITQDL
jgi:hypothetical protein